MLFGIIILALIAGVALIHYIQGFFSAMISAVIVILAAVVAVGYHEQLATSVLGSIPNYAHATALVGLFAVSYVVVRLIADKAIPGNVRMPLLVDKIGAGVFGFVAGIYGTGVLVLAAQLVPVGPSVAGYSRFDLADREANSVRVPGKYSMQDLAVFGEMKDDQIDSTKSAALFPIPVDGILLNTVAYLSDGGSLAGDVRLAEVHPSYPDELFGERVGPMKGGDCLIGKVNSHPVGVTSVYSAQTLVAGSQDFELKQIRGDKSPVLVPAPDLLPVALRITMENPSPNSQPFNPASIRLVVGGNNYFPVGFVQRGEQMYRTRPDDILFMDGHKPVDLVFRVDTSSLPPKAGGGGRVFPPGSFIEIRRAREALGDREISESVPPNNDAGVLLKDPNTQR